MRVKTILRIACAIAAAGTWLWMSACTMTLPQSSRVVTGKSFCTTPECKNQPSTGSIALLSPYNDVDQGEPNRYRAQCGAQARPRNHEVESCRAVPVINLTF
jgi:hypothetical protein